MHSEPARSFGQQPHRTMLSLSVPVMGSLVAEPLASLVDTAFVERLGMIPAAGLGAAAIVLFSTVWVFNFLNIGTQTEVARAYGRNDMASASAWSRLALRMSIALGFLLGLVMWLLLPQLAAFMSDEPAVIAQTRAYLEIRLLGTPATLLTLAACGALRGLSLMRLPLWITALSAAVNIALDPLFIFGFGPVPGCGVAGAATATVISQYAAVTVAVYLLFRHLPSTANRAGNGAARTAGADREPPRGARLLHVGRDMILRTGALLLFLLLSTRVAVHAGPEMGAIHQGVRQLWMLLAFLQDAFATSAQSLVGYFLGAGLLHRARQVALVAFQWALSCGCLLGLVLLPAAPVVHAVLAPLTSDTAFRPVLWICALAQPISALSFVTDGLLWGAGEYRYMRNVMMLSSGACILLLQVIPKDQTHTLTLVWWITAALALLRAVSGVIRIVPGFGPVWGPSGPVKARS